MPIRLTLLGRSSLLLLAELLANGICWAVAAILFARKAETRSILSLALLAWTLGLRHALDADHISAIDNATRGLINLGQLPVTCGLFFSLGHSTIVLVVTIAIAVSTDVYERMNGVGEVGGIVGAAVSGSFLFIIGVANTIILWRIIKRRRRDKARAKANALSPDQQDLEGDNEKANRTIMMRILGPVVTFVNRPWKMYPVGVLFGFGFDTASSIALLGISAVAKRNSTEGSAIPSSHIVILPLLFTAAMTLLDSVDSVIMLYSYTGFPQRSWKLIEFRPKATVAESQTNEVPSDVNEKVTPDIEEIKHKTDIHADVVEAQDDERIAAQRKAKMNVMSGLSIILTVMSVLVAFSISLITIMGLIGENCAKCIAAAEAEDGGGLAGSWWRGWAAAGEQSGWIGIGIVGGFVVIVAGWYLGRWLLRLKRSQRPGETEAETEETTGDTK